MRVLKIIFIFIFILFFLPFIIRAELGNTIIYASVPGSLSINLIYPQLQLPENHYFYQNLTVFQSSSIETKILINKTDANNFVKFVNFTGGGVYYQDNYSLSLNPNVFFNITIRIYIQPGQGYVGGTYEIPIYAYSLNDTRANTTTLRIIVNNTNPVDDISITDIYPSSLYKGQTLKANISIEKKFPYDPTDIQICYCISTEPSYQCGPEYNNYGCEWRMISNILNYTKSVIVNENPNKYYFIVAVKYEGDEIIKRAISPAFYVQQTPSLPPSGPSGIPFFLLPKNITEKPEFEIISEDYFHSSPSRTFSFEVEVKNIGNSNAYNTTLMVYGIEESWVDIYPLVQDIEKSSSKKYQVKISIPTKTSEKVYHLFLVAKSGEIEKTKSIILVVAFDIKEHARFLIGEGYAKKNEAYNIKEKLKQLKFDASKFSNQFEIADLTLSNAVYFFEKNEYNQSIKKSKETIELYKKLINDMKEIVVSNFYLLFDNIDNEIKKIQSEDTFHKEDVFKIIRNKVSESIILYEEGRIIEAYELLIEVKEILEEIYSNIQIQKLYNFVVLFSVVLFLVMVIATVILYKKKASTLSKKIKMEEQKKSLKLVFDKKLISSEESAKEKQKLIEKQKEVVEEIPKIKLKIKKEDDEKDNE